MRPKYVTTSYIQSIWCPLGFNSTHLIHQSVDGAAEVEGAPRSGSVV
jgi:hypothetical protein